MLAFFPPAYPDETLEHRCARYASLLHFPWYNHPVREMFGPGRRAISLDLPVALGQLVERLPPGHSYTVERLCATHTLYPYYAPFMTAVRQARLLERMARDDGRAIHSGSGISASSAAMPAYTRFCPDCVTADRAQFGEAYFHRSHQLPSSLVCHRHGGILQNSALPYHQRRTRYQLFTAEGVLADSTLALPCANPPEQFQQSLLALAQAGHWLLENWAQTAVLDGPAWAARYRHGLMAQGWITFSGRIRARQLLEAFLRQFPPTFLELFHADFSHNTQPWLLNLLKRTERFHHPLYHLLLSMFMAIPLEALCRPAPAPAYFGAAPWPCLNKVCDRFNEAVIASVAISLSSDSRRPVGRFSCPSCGMVYCRVGPDTAPEDRWRISYYDELGPVWEEALRRSWDSPLSLNAIAQLLGVDSQTVKRHAQRLQLLYPRPGQRPFSHPQPASPTKNPDKTAPMLEKRAAQRETWLTLLAAHPHSEVKALRQRDSQTYAWLYRHDREWLKAHSPATPPHKVEKRWIDWPLRDVLLASRCLIACLDLLSSEKKVLRLSATAVCRQAQQALVIKHRATNLPLTHALVGRLAESRTQYATRRIWRVAAALAETGQTLPEWQLVRLSGTSRVQKTPEIQAALTAVTHWLRLSAYERQHHADRNRLVILPGFQRLHAAPGDEWHALQ